MGAGVDAQLGERGNLAQSISDSTFGALVWIFQDGHLGALGTTATGTLVVTVPPLLFCIAFGLSMDYEVFRASRIRKYWLAFLSAADATAPGKYWGIRLRPTVVCTTAVPGRCRG